MDYLQIIVNGFDKSVFPYLHNYYNRECKKAEEKGYAIEEFFSNCLMIIEQFKQPFLEKEHDRKKEVYLMLNYAKNKNDIEGIELSKQDLEEVNNGNYRNSITYPFTLRVDNQTILLRLSFQEIETTEKVIKLLISIKKNETQMNTLKQEIKEMKEEENLNTSKDSNFQLSSKKGNKINLIRILNAIYELKMIEYKDGQIPTKQDFMENFGNFLGIDLSKYDTDLSQSFNSSLESNLAIFETMKEKAQQQHTDKQERN